MKAHLLVSALCLTLFSTYGIAGDKEGVYVGIKAGTLKVDVSDTGLDADNANTFSLVGGYQFSNKFAAELEFIPTTDIDVNLGGVKAGTVSVQTVGVYGAYRIQPDGTPAYFKVRLGLLSEQVDGKSSITGNSTSSSDSGLSFGVGAGFDVASNMMIEAEYTLIEQDVDFISVGLNVKF